MKQWEMVNMIDSATGYTLEKRPWQEMGFSVKTQWKQHFRVFFHHYLKSRFSSSKKAMGVIGPRLCLKIHWFTIAVVVAVVLVVVVV